MRSVLLSGRGVGTFAAKAHVKGRAGRNEMFSVNACVPVAGRVVMGSARNA